MRPLLRSREYQYSIANVDIPLMDEYSRDIYVTCEFNNRIFENKILF